MLKNRRRNQGRLEAALSGTSGWSVFSKATVRCAWAAEKTGRFFVQPVADVARASFERKRTAAQCCAIS